MIQRGLFALSLPIMFVLFIPWLAVSFIVDLVMIPIALVYWVVSGNSGLDLFGNYPLTTRMESGILNHARTKRHRG